MKTVLMNTRNSTLLLLIIGSFLSFLLACYLFIWGGVPLAHAAASIELVTCIIGLTAAVLTLQKRRNRE
jgi:hypothetical protein